MVDDPLVEVRVLVNVDGLRRGQVGQVELTPRIQLLADRGYLRILGHVNVVPVAPVVPEPPAPTETPAARPRPSRAKRKPSAVLPDEPQEAPGGDSTGDAGA